MYFLTFSDFLFQGLTSTIALMNHLPEKVGMYLQEDQHVKGLFLSKLLKNKAQNKIKIDIFYRFSSSSSSLAI